ncbi:hypothetical protein MLD38_001781 [Melastoma candidum]|uniref:Uncharacterized protein n=1 Tax=Melastoma candidum TaxID=119954 RepID=A0ACB9SDN2_9MYRT|nr:hypothetical protein MLD38_001781 [Melastoma candidum]
MAAAASRMLSRPTSRDYSVPVRCGGVPLFRLNNKGISSVRCLSDSVADRSAAAVGGCIESRRPTVAVKAVAAPERVVAVEHGVLLKRLLEELRSMVCRLSTAASVALITAARMRPWRYNIQMLLEKGMLDCRFFTLLAVAGSMVGSILCFVEGCFLVSESYVEYFHMLSQHTDTGHMVHLLVEALDMFLVGTAMLTFGASLHVMCVGSRTSAARRLWLPTWVGTRSVLKAKSRVGHAVMMILQVGVLEKFKSIPLTTGLDLACFAGAMLLSSASIFVLSKLSIGTAASAEKSKHIA